jgi:carbonic anhydrase/acetyltransferase-like protein (isoleucine patch superfamily)
VLIRADLDKVTIGENSNIQDGCILHIDEGSLIGMKKWY